MTQFSKILLQTTEPRRKRRLAREDRNLPLQALNPKRRVTRFLPRCVSVFGRKDENRLVPASIERLDQLVAPSARQSGATLFRTGFSLSR